jgi:UDP-N-acetylglucosamine transferase subunit ALG13
MAASGGGHLDLLLSIEPALGGLPDAWITVEGDRARGLRESGKSVHALAPLDRNHLSLRNPLQALRLALELRPALLEPLGRGRNGDGQGTFVAVGTHPEPFDRLLEMVDSAAGAGVLPEPIVAQTGPSGYEAQNFEKQPWITRDRFGVAVTEARYVIGHAGSGLVGAALRAGRKPLVLARGGQDEHVDDHQTQLAAKLEQLDLAVRLGDEISRRDLASADAGLPEADPFGDAAELGHAVREEVDRCMQTTRQGDANGRSRDHAQQRR